MTTNKEGRLVFRKRLYSVDGMCYRSKIHTVDEECFKARGDESRMIDVQGDWQLLVVIFHFLAMEITDGRDHCAVFISGEVVAKLLHASTF